MGHGPLHYRAPRKNHTSQRVNQGADENDSDNSDSATTSSKPSLLVATKMLWHNILGATSKDGFELVLWLLAEETMRETFGSRRQTIFAAMLKKFFGKRIVPQSMCGYDWWF